VTQFTISCAVELLTLVTSDDLYMTSSLTKLSISIKIHLVKPLCLVSKLSTESVGSRRELVANCVHNADADATQLDSCVASALCIEHYRAAFKRTLNYFFFMSWGIALSKVYSSDSGH